MFKTLTQGGQVHLHQLRMFKQVLSAGLLVALLTGGSFFLWKAWHIPAPFWRATLEVTKAKILLANTFESNQNKVRQLYTPPSFFGRSYSPYSRRCKAILRDPALKRHVQELKHDLQSIGFQSLGVGGVAFLLLMLFWLRRGNSHAQIQHQRGSTFIETKALAKLIRKNGDASDLRIGPLPLIKNKETSHMLLTGTTGSGKTNLIHTLLPHIQKRGDRAIVVDMTGEYVNRYYKENRDVLLNPFDPRSLPWTPWADLQKDVHYDVLTHALIQPQGQRYSDPFWDNASRGLLKAALKKFAAIDYFDAGDLYTLLTSSNEAEYCAFFEGTEAASYASPHNEKTTSSIRSVLITYLDVLKHLKTPEEGDRGLSIREWVAREKTSRDPGWLFLTCRPDERKTLTPLLSAWIDIGINALMSLPPSPQRRLWLILDELPVLQRLPSLQMGLAEARKYGGCFLVGIQSKPQLEEIYGKNGAESMLDLLNTKIFFRCTEPSTQVWISRVLGDKEEAEPHGTISYGAHSLRDGVSLTHQFRNKPLILPSELAQLEDLTCYVKLPGGYPCTKVRMELYHSSLKDKAFFYFRPRKELAQIFLFCFRTL